MIKLIIALFLFKITEESFKNPYKTKVTNIVAMKIQIGKTMVEKPIIIGLFGKEVPYTIENFYALCVNKGLKKNGINYTYKNTKFYRVIKDFMIQGGDITNNNGKGGESIWGGKFFDENFNVKHDIGVVSMANNGKNSNNSQFFITTTKTDWLDEKNVVFGIVLYGMDTVYLIETLDNGTGIPTEDILITDCYDPTANFFV